MDRAQVCQYIKDQFSVVGTYRWRRFPDNCVFASPVSKRWFAVLIRQNADPLRLNDRQVQDFLDIYAGANVFKLRRQGQFTNAYMMSSQDWVGMKLDSNTDIDLVQTALNQAFELTAKPNDIPEKEQLLHIKPMDFGANSTETVYHDQKIPFAKQHLHNQQIAVGLPEPLRQMKSLYDYSLPPVTGRNRNFYVQANFLADYQDDFDYQGEFKHFFPTYHDMSDRELRGYFSWRTKWRNGESASAPQSFLYVYLYELLNNVGVTDPADGFEKLASFIKQAGKQADKKMQLYIKQWMKDYVIYYQLGGQYKKIAFADELKTDQAYDVLLQPQGQDDHAIAMSLDSLASYHFAKKCPLMKKHPALAEKLVAESWRQLHHDETGGDAASLLGWRGEITVRLFGNAVFYDRQPVASQDYKIDDQRSYQCKWGVWHRQSITPLKGRTRKLNDFFHEIDRQLRRHYQVGRQLKARSLTDEQVQAIVQAWQKINQEAAEAKKQQIKINMNHLAQIRADAAVTADSLLTDEEKQAELEENQRQAKSDDQAAGLDAKTADEDLAAQGNLNLSDDESYFLNCLLNNKPYDDYLKSHHLMDSILADQVNEKLFDEIGDMVIEFNDDGQAQLIDDYREDIADLFS